MKRTISRAVVVLAAAMLLAGCGGGEKPAGGPVAQQPTGGPAPAPPPLIGPGKPQPQTSPAAPPRKKVSTRPAPGATELEGTWHVVSAESDGRTDDSVKGQVELVFQGGKLLMKRGGDVMEGKAVLNPKANPKTIDMLMPGRRGGTETVQGIYLLEGDTLKICGADNPGEARPTDFTTKRGDHRNLVVLKRGAVPAGSRPKVDRISQQNSLKELSLAMLNYMTSYKEFPPQAIRGKDGRPLLSWRVAILPYIEQDSLYKKFHLDEPWDSPHNKTLLAKMPPVYRSAGEASPTMTSFMVFTGEGTPFAGPKGPMIRDIRDGTSNTIMLVAAGPDKAVPWTRPEDVPFDKANPVAALGTLADDVVLVALMDGSVLAIPKSTDAETLRRLIQHQDGQTVDPRSLIKSAEPREARPEKKPVPQSAPSTSPPRKRPVSQGVPSSNPPGVGFRELANFASTGGRFGDRIAISADGRLVAAVENVANQGNSERIQVWDVQTKAVVHTFGPFDIGVRGIALSPDGKSLAVSINKFPWHVHMMDVASGREKWKVPAKGAVAFSPDGAVLVTATGPADDPTELIWLDARTGRVQKTYKGVDKSVSALGFSRDGKTLLCGRAENGVFVHGQPPRPLETRSKQEDGGKFAPVECVAFSPDGKKIAASRMGVRKGNVSIWDAASGRETHLLEVFGNVSSVVFLGDNTTLLAPSAGNPETRGRCIELWDADEGRRVGSFVVEKMVDRMALSADGTILAASQSDGVTVWKLEGVPPIQAITPVATTPGEAPDAKPAPTQGVRTWTSADGKFRVEAELVKMVAGVVYLKRADGSVIQVPMDKLSEEDQKFLKKR